jgi:ABC-type antimicrobial peptide transport system permease subunit
MHTTTRTLRTATIALRRNVLRSALTCLGIIIGVAAVIAMMEIGQGASSAIAKSIASMGANTVNVSPGAKINGGVNLGSGSAMTLTPDDCEAIRRECPAVRYAAPEAWCRTTQLIYGSRNWIPRNISGTTASFLDIHNWYPLAAGEPFTDADVRNAAKVCIVGQTLVRELFAGENPVGQSLRAGAVTLRVVGTLTAKGADMFGNDQDDILIAPWTTVKYRISNQSGNSAGQQAAAVSTASSSSSSTTVNTLSNLYPSTSGGNSALYPVMSTVQQADTPLPVRFSNVDQVICAAGSAAGVQRSVDEITALLHQRHHMGNDLSNDFRVQSATAFADMLGSTTTRMASLLLSVAVLSLLVGGVGIMNIMLVSVTERTREIGLRLAVGARGIDILQQFLIEAVILCLAGGAVGIALGRFVSWLVREFLHYPTEVSIPAIVASVIVSATVGVVFGFYPAWKAARLDPIDALRYE